MGPVIELEKPDGGLHVDKFHHLVLKPSWPYKGAGAGPKEGNPKRRWGAQGLTSRKKAGQDSPFGVLYEDFTQC